MKNYKEYQEDVPPLWEPIEFFGVAVVPVPHDLVHSCRGCIGRTGPFPAGSKTCHELPPCSGIAYISKDDFDTDEMKVKTVKWRMGLEDE